MLQALAWTFLFVPLGLELWGKVHCLGCRGVWRGMHVLPIASQAGSTEA